MSVTQGYYSLVQYCPDPSRAETANIGVVVFSPQLRRIEVRLAENTDRVRRFFGIEDSFLVDAQKHSLIERLKSDQIFTVEQFSDFAARRAHSLRFTAPRSVKISDLDQDLNSLFARLVGEPARQKTTRAKELLDKTFRQAGVIGMLTTHIGGIPIPNFKREIRVPYGYKNGRFNLIEPVSFVSATAAFNTACTRAVQGREIFHYKSEKYGRMKLVVVGQFSSESEREEEVVRKVLKEHDVDFYPLSAVDPLLEDIRKHASAE